MVQAQGTWGHERTGDAVDPLESMGERKKTLDCKVCSQEPGTEHEFSGTAASTAMGKC